MNDLERALELAVLRLAADDVPPADIRDQVSQTLARVEKYTNPAMIAREELLNTRTL